MTALAAKDDAARLTIGGNKGPLLTKEELAAGHDDKLTALSNLLEQARALPEVIGSDDDDGLTTDVVRALQTAAKDADAARVAVKAPYLAAERLVDSFFKTSLIDKMEKAKGVLEGRLTAWKRKKADAERQRLLAVAQAAREEAERVAAEAARVRQSAMRERMEQEFAAAFDETPVTLAPQQMGEVKAAENAALDAAYDARAAEKQAYVKPAELTRIRSASGEAASTLVQSWTFEITDINAVSLDALRAFIPRADIEKAIRRHVAINKGDKPLAGVRIYSEENARVY